ncbi:diacylglycerol/lipid kinase family protein [Paenisporosarcina quisquiliarum]|uniref:diacylglycerol/lipid kinase family protein n=1 Tax=Paenisporosarcina quisquiliarum TaxID=365346 RepID=UPI0037357F0A
MRVTFIINPLAGNGKAERKWQTFKEGLDFPYEFFLTRAAKDATAIATDVSKDNEKNHLIIAFGGDGTVHEVIEGLLDTDFSIVGVVGAGSGNDFGRGYVAFKTPVEINEYVRSEKNHQMMDIGIIQNKNLPYYFVNNAGLGFDAFVAFKVNQSPFKKWLNQFGLGKLTYTYFVIYTLLTFKRFNLSISTKSDQLEFKNVWFATVSNQPYFGGGMKISPTSNPSDGLLELTVVHDLSRLKLLVVFATVFFGKHTNFKEVHQMQAPLFKLSTDTSVYRHTDGEFAGLTEPFIEDEFNVQQEKWRLVQ